MPEESKMEDVDKLRRKKGNKINNVNKKYTRNYTHKLLFKNSKKTRTRHYKVKRVYRILIT